MEILSIIGWALSVGTQEMVGNFAFMKIEKYRVITGLGELLGVVLLLIPATSLFGAILIASFMSAAVVMHLSLMGGAKTYFPIVIGITGLLGHFLRVF